MNMFSTHDSPCQQNSMSEKRLHWVVCVCVCVCVCVYIHTHIHIYTEREREREIFILFTVLFTLVSYVYILTNV